MQREKNRTKWKDQSYYTQVDEDIDRNHNHSSEVKYTYDNKRLPSMEQMTYMYQITDMEHMPVNEHKIPSLPVNGRKIHTKEQINVR